jgi:hypothetical protein
MLLFVQFTALDTLGNIATKINTQSLGYHTLYIYDCIHLKSTHLNKFIKTSNSKHIPDYMNTASI